VIGERCTTRSVNTHHEADGNDVRTVAHGFRQIT
jgi:hypothetical protein